MRKNGKPGHCSRCGHWLEPGQAEMWVDIDDDDERPRWLIACLEKAECKARKEAATVAAQAKAQAQRERDTELRAIRDLFLAGTLPAGPVELPGERLYLRDRDSVIYGGGEWVVIDGEKIWYVINNGHDGDDWSRNNVRTGGAGAIGWFLPWNDALAERVKKAVEK